MKSLLTVLLCSSLTLNAPCQEKRAAGVGVGIVVVCAGAVCVYLVAKFCQKHFPKTKPANTNELYSISGGAGDESGGSWNYGALGSCLTLPGAAVTQDSSGTPSPTTFALNVRVRSRESVITSMEALRDEESFQSWTGFQNETASHGLAVTGVADGSQFFSRNRQPVSAGEVPIRFGPEPGMVTVSSGTLVKVAIERSVDLQTWESLLTVQQPAGTAFRVLDTSIETHAFYRANIAPE